MLDIEVRGLKQLARALEASRKEEVRALETAIKVEAFNIRKVLREQIKQGAPGGRPFAPLSVIGAHSLGRGRFSKTRRSRRALRKLATALRYDVDRSPNFQVTIGWPRGLRSLARAHQEGQTRPATEDLKRFLRRAGGQLRGRWAMGRGRSGGYHFSENRFARYFFLRKETKQLRTPARPIMDPFWGIYQQRAWRNIRQNFIKKSRGERI